MEVGEDTTELIALRPTQGLTGHVDYALAILGHGYEGCLVPCGRERLGHLGCLCGTERGK